ncbi:TrkH family potassium uptake protein [bacterium]|nr:TrkH family potassium uptake protein [bacterium]
MRLNYLSNALGLILTDIGLVTFTPILVALYYGEYGSILPFFTAGIFALALGDILRKVVKNASDVNALNDIKRSEALVIASFAWGLFALIAAIPFMCSGFSVIDSFFEAVSGITTTGATILTSFDISKSLLFWRSFTQWLGGMGIIVLFVAILPQFAVAGRQMFFAEAPGPTEEKLTPRIKNTASVLWIAYASLTLICAFCLWFAGMNPFDCICNAMSTLSAGGFSPNPESIGGYHSNAITLIILIFMFIAGASFVVQAKVVTKLDLRYLWKSEEFKFYSKIILIVSTILAAFLFFESDFSIKHSFVAAFYQVLSLSTSTGSSSENYHLWTFDAKVVLFVAMFLSSCSGSAGGGLKMTRWLLICKYIKNEVYKILHPNAVLSVKIDNVVVAPDVLRQTLFFVFCFFGIFAISALIITLTEENVVIGVTSAIASLGDIGPALGSVIGPFGNYSSMHVITKIILVFNMLIGRLEIIPFLVLFQKDIWSLKK